MVKFSTVWKRVRNDWNNAFVMSQSGNPACHPEPFRNTKSGQWKYFKKEDDRDDYFRIYSGWCTFTMMRDFSILRIVDKDVPLRDEPHVVKIWDMERNIWSERCYIDCSISVLTHKPFYGLVDIYNGFSARYGLDLKQNRKIFRVNVTHTYLMMGLLSFIKYCLKQSTISRFEFCFCGWV